MRCKISVLRRASLLFLANRTGAAVAETQAEHAEQTDDRFAPTWFSSLCERLPAADRCVGS
jgi:hypothetical protein